MLSTFVSIHGLPLTRQATNQLQGVELFLEAESSSGTEENLCILWNLLITVPKVNHPFSLSSDIQIHYTHPTLFLEDRF